MPTLGSYYVGAEWKPGTHKPAPVLRDGKAIPWSDKWAAHLASRGWNSEMRVWERVPHPNPDYEGETLDRWRTVKVVRPEPVELTAADLAATP